MANRRATVPEIADQNLPATRAEPHAHTASGRNIIGFWGWTERLVLVATFLSIIAGAWFVYEERQIWAEQKMTGKQRDVLSLGKF